MSAKVSPYDKGREEQAIRIAQAIRSATHDT